MQLVFREMTKNGHQGINKKGASLRGGWRTCPSAQESLCTGALKAGPP